MEPFATCLPTHCALPLKLYRRPQGKGNNRFKSNAPRPGSGVVGSAEMPCKAGSAWGVGMVGATAGKTEPQWARLARGGWSRGEVAVAGLLKLHQALDFLSPMPCARPTHEPVAAFAPPRLNIEARPAPQIMNPGLSLKCCPRASLQRPGGTVGAIIMPRQLVGLVARRASPQLHRPALNEGRLTAIRGGGRTVRAGRVLLLRLRLARSLQLPRGFGRRHILPLPGRPGVGLHRGHLPRWALPQRLYCMVASLLPGSHQQAG